MSFFNRKKEEAKPCCCSGNAPVTKYDAVSGEVTSVKVLGAGCKSCRQMYENTKQAAEDLGLGIEVEYITDMEKVMQYGAMSMPVLVINEKVVSAGKVLKPHEVFKLLTK